MDQKYFIYILECCEGSYYVGCTDDIKQRVYRHNFGEAADWTRQRRPVKLVYQEEYENLPQARRREKQLKGWTRRKKANLISGLWRKYLPK